MLTTCEAGRNPALALRAARALLNGMIRWTPPAARGNFSGVISLRKRNRVSTATQLSLDLRIETPENVVLTQMLAGPAWRGTAYLVDFMLRVAILFVASIFACIVAVGFLSGVAIGTLLLLVFLLEWGYFIGCEFFWNGRTPGKYLCGLRVIHENGQPLSWWGATLRNLLRAADTLPMLLVFGEQLGALAIIPAYGTGLCVLFLSGKLQRLGDLAARTVVIHERRSVLPRSPVIYRHIEALPSDQINSVRPRSSTLAVIDEFLGRRKVLTHERGHALARSLAETLADRLDYRGDRAAVSEYPMAFLARVYVTFAPPQELREEPARRGKRRRQEVVG